MIGSGELKIWAMFIRCIADMQLLLPWMWLGLRRDVLPISGAAQWVVWCVSVTVELSRLRTGGHL